MLAHLFWIPFAKQNLDVFRLLKLIKKCPYQCMVVRIPWNRWNRRFEVRLGHLCQKWSTVRWKDSEFVSHGCVTRCDKMWWNVTKCDKKRKVKVKVMLKLYRKHLYYLDTIKILSTINFQAEWWLLQSGKQIVHHHLDEYRKCWACTTSIYTAAFFPLCTICLPSLSSLFALLMIISKTSSVLNSLIALFCLFFPFFSLFSRLCLEISKVKMKKMRNLWKKTEKKNFKLFQDHFQDWWCFPDDGQALKESLMEMKG